MVPLQFEGDSQTEGAEEISVEEQLALLFLALVAALSAFSRRWAFRHRSPTTTANGEVIVVTEQEIKE